MKLYYLSFADPNRPKGTQWLGCAYVEAESLTHAIFHKSHEHNCNPGGEVMSIELRIDTPVKAEYRNRLLNEDDLRKSGPEDDDVLVDRDGNVIPKKEPQS